MANLGLNIKLHRIMADLTQEELAKKIDTDTATICRYENNERTPRLEILKRMSELFNVTIDELVNKTWEKTNQDKNND